MIRKWISILLCLLLCGAPAVTASASEVALVIDQADLLDERDVQALALEALALWENYRMHAVILTLDGLGGSSAQEAADDYYDQNGFGEDGVLFLLAMEEREWYISTSGEAIYALTDYALYEIEGVILPYLQSGNYYGAFDAFLSSLPDYFDAYETGDSITGYIPQEDRYTNHTDVIYADDRVDVGSSIIMGCGAGLIVAVVAILIMRGTMNTKRFQYSAGEYIKAGSYNLTRQQDIFLYSQVSKTRRPEPSSNSGGGSGVHRSSGGRSHGGRGGKF